jgi:flagellar hook-length control protein FliK
MNRPIDSLNNTKPADWAAKLTATPASTEASALQSDFSRWMERHATVAPQPSANASKGAAGQDASAVETRNAMARAQASALQAKRQTPVAKPEAAHAPKVDKPKTTSADASKAPAAQTKTDAVKGKTKDTTAKAASQDDTAQDEATDAAADAAKLSTGTADGSALVKDMQPADPAASGDASSMLAWLASLTHGEAPAKKAALDTTAAKPGADDASGGPLGMNALLGGAGGRGDAPIGAAAGHDKGAAAAIDVSTLQAAEGRLAVLPEGADPAAKGLDFASTLSTEMMRGMAGKATEAHATAPQASDSLPTPVNSPEFPQALAERVGMWVKGAGEDGTLSAELHLNPAEMGPISVKISLDGQSAQVDFAAANLETRRAIEASLPMLSASLDDAGLKLGGSGVSDQSPQQQFGQAPGQPGGTPAWGGGSGADMVSGDQQDGRLAAAAQAGRRGGLDLYA